MKQQKCVDADSVVFSGYLNQFPRESYENTDLIKEVYGAQEHDATFQETFLGASGHNYFAINYTKQTTENESRKIDRGNLLIDRRCTISQQTAYVTIFVVYPIN